MEKKSYRKTVKVVFISEITDFANEPVKKLPSDEEKEIERENKASW